MSINHVFGASTHLLVLLLLLVFVEGMGMKNKGVFAEETEYGEYIPPMVSYNELVNPVQTSIKNVNVLAKVRSALAEVGLITISQVPGFAELRVNVLTDAAECARESFSEAESERFNIFETEFTDGTSRRTFGFSRNSDSESNNDAYFNTNTETEGNLVPACTRFLRSRALFRATIRAASHLFISRLDEICESNLRYPVTKGVKRMEKGKGSMKSIQEVAFSGKSLDHFHVYNSSATNKSESKSRRTMELHTDHGLFVAFAPAILLSRKHDQKDYFSAGGDRSFLIQLASGDIVRPRFHDAGNVLVFMLGDGASQYFNKLSVIPLRAVPHAVEVEVSHYDTRSWFGSMYLAPMDTVVESSNKTIAENLKDMLEMPNNETDPDSHGHRMSFGCSQQMVHKELALGGCAQNEMFCWTQCMPFTTDASPDVCHSAGKDLVCADPKGNIWKSGMCTDCRLRCEKPKESNDTSNGFCNGLQTVMFMKGFTGFGKQPQDACLVFLFEFLVIDNWLKYFLSAVGAFLLGISVEFVVHIRRGLQYSEYKNRLLSPMLTTTVLHMTQVVLGYFAMLIAMTFSSLLFASTVLGIASGHILFNHRAPVSENDACCQYMDIPAPDIPEPPNVLPVVNDSACCSGNGLQRPLLRE